MLQGNQRERTFVFVVLLAIAVWVPGCQHGKTFDTWETANSKFRIRITAREEGGWVGGVSLI